MNRQQRRAQKRAEKKPEPHYKSLTKQERMDALVKNGITIKDLEQNYTDGYNAGFKDACPSTFKTIYAAICLALNEKHGFGRKRCMDVLQEVDRIVIEYLTSMEAIDEVYKRMGLYLDFDEGIERIKETEG